MFLSSASVTRFATHLTPRIINFASQLTRCVIIFASRSGLCILITVCNGPGGRLQLGGAGSRCWPAPAPSGAAWCRHRARGLPAQTGPGGAGTAAETRCHLLLLCPDPNLTPLPSSAPLQPCPSSFNCSHLGSHDTFPHLLLSRSGCAARALRPHNNLQGVHKFFVPLQVGGSFGRRPWKNQLT